MSSVKDTVTIELLKAELRTLIGAIEQNQFFMDNGNEFERKAAARYVLEKSQKAEVLVKALSSEITDLENNSETADLEKPTDSTG